MKRQRRARMSGVTPFIDMLFILLFGLLALSEAKKSTSAELVRVRLPEVEPAEDAGAGEKQSIVLVVDSKSVVTLEGRPGTIEDAEALDAALSEVVGDRLPEQFTVEIRGDADSDTGVVVALLQHLRRSGFAGVRLLALGAEDVTWGDGD